MTRYPAPAAALLGLAVAFALTACPAAQPPTVPADAPATYDTVARAVFSSCNSRSCHSAQGTKGGLTLTVEAGYEQLVDVPAQHEGAKAKGKLRVKKGDPDASFLIQKLEGPAAGEGDMMPQRSQKLPPETIALVRRWIAAGCPK